MVRNRTDLRRQFRFLPGFLKQVKLYGLELVGLEYAASGRTSFDPFAPLVIAQDNGPGERVECDACLEKIVHAALDGLLVPFVRGDNDV